MGPQKFQKSKTLTSTRHRRSPVAIQALHEYWRPREQESKNSRPICCIRGLRVKWERRGDRTVAKGSQKEPTDRKNKPLSCSEVLRFETLRDLLKLWDKAFGIEERIRRLSSNLFPPPLFFKKKFPHRTRLLLFHLNSTHREVSGVRLIASSHNRPCLSHLPCQLRLQC